MSKARPHRPIPVERARAIARQYRKSMVLIVAHDREHGVADVVTFGESPADKLWAADNGEAVMELLCGPGAQGRTIVHEDFRHRPAAEAQARIDRLEQLLDQAARAISLLTLLQQEIIQTLTQTQEQPDVDRRSETPPPQVGPG